MLDTEYLLDGKPIDRSLIEEWLPKRKSESGRQGVEKAVILRDYELVNIRSVTFDGITIQVG